MPLQGKPRLDFYRVNVSSANRTSGTLLDGTFRIDLPEFIDVNRDWQCAIEGFFTDGVPTSTFLVSCPQLTMGNNYSTTADNAGLSTIMFASTTKNYNRSVNADAFGFKVKDAAFLRGQTINIKILDISGSPYAAGGITGWFMTLVFYPWTWVDGG